MLHNYGHVWSLSQLKLCFQWLKATHIILFLCWFLLACSVNPGDFPNITHILCKKSWILWPPPSHDEMAKILYNSFTDWPRCGGSFRTHFYVTYYITMTLHKCLPQLGPQIFWLGGAKQKSRANILLKCAQVSHFWTYNLESKGSLFGFRLFITCVFGLKITDSCSYIPNLFMSQLSLQFHIYRTELLHLVTDTKPFYVCKLDKWWCYVSYIVSTSVCEADVGYSGQLSVQQIFCQLHNSTEVFQS